MEAIVPSRDRRALGLGFRQLVFCKALSQHLLLRCIAPPFPVNNSIFSVLVLLSFLHILLLNLAACANRQCVLTKGIIKRWVWGRFEAAKVGGIIRFQSETCLWLENKGAINSNRICILESLIDRDLVRFPKVDVGGDCCLFGYSHNSSPESYTMLPAFRVIMRSISLSRPRT